MKPLAVAGLQAQTAECLVVAEVATPCMIIALNKIDLVPEQVGRQRGLGREGTSFGQGNKGGEWEAAGASRVNFAGKDSENGLLQDSKDGPNWEGMQDNKVTATGLCS